MFGKLGLYQTVAVGAVVVGVAGWALYSQTDWFRPTPVIEAADGPLAVASDSQDDSAEVAEPVVEETAEPDVVEDDSETQTNTGDTQDLGDSDGVAADENTEEAEPAEVETSEPMTEEEPVAVELSVPSFDVVRVETDGMTVVAGRGPAGWLVSILVDGVAVETVEIDATGQFVALLDIGESETARVITLSAKNADQILLSDAQVIIAPVVRQIAATEETAPEVEDTTETAETETPVVEEAAEQVEDVVGAEVAQVADAPVVEAVADAADQSDAAEGGVESVDVVTDEAAEEVTNDVAAQVVNEVAEQVADAAEEIPTVSDAITDVAKAAVEEQPNEAVAAEETTQVELSADVASPSLDAPVTPAAADTAASDGMAEVAETPTAVATEEPSPVEATVEEEPAPVEVVEDAAPAVILVENDSVTVLQSSSNVPQVLDELSIAAITYSDDGEVQISGFSPAGYLRVYLNNVQIAVLEVPEPGQWQAELVDVEPGVYTLRVDQVDEQGQVVSRVETPFKREEPAKVVEAAQSRKPLVSVEVVQPGSTLWAISRETYGSGVLYVNIFEANKDQIRNPHLIYPGQIFELPAPPGAKKKKRTSGQ